MTQTATVEPAATSTTRDLCNQFFDGRVDAGHRHHSEDWFARYADELLAMMPQGGTLLDLGCGSCQITTHMARAFDRVIGVDLSDSMLKAGRERIEMFGLDNASALYGDAANFPAEVEEANVILAYGVIQYLDPPVLRAHLAECARVLAPGGLLCWGLVPNANLRHLWYMGALSNPRPLPRRMVRSYVKTALRWWKGKREGNILWDEMGIWFTQEELRQAAEEAGFEIEFRYSWYYEYRFHALLRKANRAVPLSAA